VTADEELIRAIAAEIDKLGAVERAVCEAAIVEIGSIVLRDGLAGKLALAMVGAAASADGLLE
jgi:chorismate synthase